MTVDDLLEAVGAERSPADRQWIEDLLQGLAADGLAEVTLVDGEVRVAAPR